MRLWIVTKAPVDLGDAYEIVGVFTHPVKADNAVKAGGAGTYLIMPVEHDRAYKSGQLLGGKLIAKVAA